MRAPDWGRHGGFGKENNSQMIFRFTVVVLVAVFLLTGCEDSDEPTQPDDPLEGAALCLSDYSCELNALCDTSTAFEVTNCGNRVVLSWEAEADSSWLRLSVASGITPGDFQIIADSNRTGTDRAAAVSVTSPLLNDPALMISVTQPTLQPTLSVSTAEWQPTAFGGESPALSVTNCGDMSTIEWDVAEVVDWLTLSTTGGSTPGSFTITADTNNTGDSRTTSVVVSASGVAGSPWPITVEQPSVVSWAGSVYTLDCAFGISLYGNYACVAARDAGLQVLDISDPFHPTRTGGLTMPDWARNVFVAGDYAYVSAADSGMVIVDISNPGNPVRMGTQQTPDFAIDVYVRGDYAYMADGNYGLFIIDVSDAANPDSVGYYQNYGFNCDVYVAGDYAYIAMSFALEIIDISDPTAPFLAGSYPGVNCTRGVFVAGDYAYIAGAGCGLIVVDVSVPSTPILAGGCDTPGSAWDVKVVGDYAYIADQEGGLQIIDVTDPSNPLIVGCYDTPDLAFGVCAAGGYAYMADWTTGLVVLELGF